MMSGSKYLIPIKYKKGHQNGSAMSPANIKENQVAVNKTKEIILLILIALLTYLPFINKAYHVDDPFYLEIVKKISEDVVHPFSIEINWFGAPQDLFVINTNPPLMQYYQAGIVYLFGDSEVTLHLSHIIFLIFLPIAIYFLNRRFTKYPFICSALLICSPALMVSSQTIYPDLTLLGIFSASIIMFIHGVDRNKKTFLIFSGILAGMASLIRYSGLTLFPILASYLILKERAINKKIFYLLIPLAIFGGWCFHNIIFYHKIHILAAMGTQDSTRSWRELKLKTLAQLTFIGGTLVFPFLFKMALTSWKNKLLALCSVLFGIFVFYRMVGRYEHSNINAGLVAIFISATVYFLLLLPVIQAMFWNLIRKNKSVRTSDDYFLLFWFILIFVFNITLWFVAVKYILLLLPPLLILLSNQLDDMKSIVKEKLNSYLTAVVVLTLVVGYVVALADYQYANVYRNFAPKLSQEYNSESNTIWFVGHWGFEYYMGKMAFKQLPKDSNSPSVGDLVVVPSIPWPERLSKNLQSRIQLIDTISYQSSLPVRTMNSAANAYFWASINYPEKNGFLPFSLSSANLEKFYIYRVERAD